MTTYELERIPSQIRHLQDSINANMEKVNYYNERGYSISGLTEHIQAMRDELARLSAICDMNDTPANEPAVAPTVEPYEQIEYASATFDIILKTAAGRWIKAIVDIPAERAIRQVERWQSESYKGERIHFQLHGCGEV